jgi:hypothetical protein
LVKRIPLPKKGLRMNRLPQGKSIKIKGGKKHAKNTLCSVLTLTYSLLGDWSPPCFRTPEASL